MSAGAGGCHTSGAGASAATAIGVGFGGGVIASAVSVSASSASAGSGDRHRQRHHHTVVALGTRQQLVGDAAVRGAHGLDLGPDLLHRFETEIDAELERQIGGDDPVGLRGARRRDSLIEAC